MIIRKQRRGRRGGGTDRKWKRKQGGEMGKEKEEQNTKKEKMEKRKNRTTLKRKRKFLYDALVYVKAGLFNVAPAGAMEPVIYFHGALIYSVGFNVNQNFKKKRNISE
jgi:hypothetical protein